MRVLLQDINKIDLQQVDKVTQYKILSLQLGLTLILGFLDAFQVIKTFFHSIIDSIIDSFVFLLKILVFIFTDTPKFISYLKTLGLYTKNLYIKLAGISSVNIVEKEFPFFLKWDGKTVLLKKIQLHFQYKQCILDNHTKIHYLDKNHQVLLTETLSESKYFKVIQEKNYLLIKIVPVHLPISFLLTTLKSTFII